MLLSFLDAKESKHTEDAVGENASMLVQRMSLDQQNIDEVPSLYTAAAAISEADEAISIKDKKAAAWFEKGCRCLLGYVDPDDAEDDRALANANKKKESIGGIPPLTIQTDLDSEDSESTAIAITTTPSTPSIQSNKAGTFSRGVVTPSNAGPTITSSQAPQSPVHPSAAVSRQNVEAVPIGTPRTAFGAAEPKYDRAAQYFQQAAQLGHTGAVYNLALCYESGRGVAQDYGKAVLCYKVAAFKGHSKAMYNLAFCYEQGRGVEKDLKMAQRYYDIVTSGKMPSERKKDQGFFAKMGITWCPCDL